MSLAEKLLQIEELTTVFPHRDGDVAAVDGLDLALDAGEIVGLVGESGCGKSLTALSIMRLLPPPGRLVHGQVRFAGESLLAASTSRMREIRGAGIAMIFQEPMTSLNPVFTVGRQIAEGIRAHADVPREQAWAQSVEALARVGIPDPARRAAAFPHQLSGGMRQRAMIAMALAMNPRLLLADEPTTALDVTIQAQILGLMQQLQAEINAGVLLITHDLAVVAQMARRVAVMYTGRLVEESPVTELFQKPLHPYTQGLLACLPSRASRRETRLPTIGGVVPPLTSLPPGCKFSDRCPHCFNLCTQAEPALVEVAPGHRVRCYLHHHEVRVTNWRAA
ncbi:MAG: ABC transporter ATP-binding protein [Deltaproteobacteria bacterium]|nr:ABC transporter ATP-binding protein [Deltaproteobacteria bacterium]